MANKDIAELGPISAAIKKFAADRRNEVTQKNPTLRKVTDAYLHRDGAQGQLIIVFCDGECVAQDIDDVSYQGWLDEGLRGVTI
jgi:hypothetical protein